jgi:hypothetical protein
MLKVTTILVVLSAVFCLVAVDAHAQTTEFTYQGSFKDGAGPANGNYDFEFKLFDLVSGGVQQGITLQRLNVPVVNGIFTVSLDFGVGTFPGASRFLDIGARTAGGGTFTGLIPRQKVNSAPYAVRSLNAATADSVAAGGIPAGSSNYIQNTAAPQSGSNFNITGNGTIGGNLTVNQGVTAAGDVFVNTGSLGLGTQTMNHRFNVVGSPCWTSDCWGARCRWKTLHLSDGR